MSTKGLLLPNSEISVDHETVEDWPVEQRAAYYSRKGMSNLGESDHQKVFKLVASISAIWEKWHEMNGDNIPLVRAKAGPRRDYDINLDGMAHYGLLPDFLQDLRNDGLTAEDLAPLFRSAYDYVQMWGTCEERGAEFVDKKAEQPEFLQAPQVGEILKNLLTYRLF